MRALVSPVRQELIDTLHALGRASIADLAERLGRPADGLYYHIRAMVAAGLVREEGQRTAGRREERVYASVAPSRRIQLRYRPKQRASAAALRRLVSSMLRTADRDFVAGLGRAGVVVDGPRRHLWAARTKGWLSPADLERVNELLVELNDLLQNGPAEDRQQLFTLTFVLAPAEPRPARRGRPRQPRRAAR